MPEDGIVAAKTALAPNHLPEAWTVTEKDDAATIEHETGSHSVTIHSASTTTTFVDNTPRHSISEFGEPHGDNLPLEPIVLTNACDDWDAFASPQKHWSVANLVQRLPPDLKLSLDGGPCFARMSLNSARVTMAQYQAYCQDNEAAAKDIAPLYLFDPDVLNSKFANDTLVQNDYSIPPCFAHDAMAPLNGSRFRPLPPAWLLVGVDRSGTPMHDHPFFVAWNALLCGCKLWCCLPPDVDEGVLLLDTGGGEEDGEEEEEDFEFDTSALEWFASFCEPQRSLPPSARIIVQQPGEVAYVPPGWWHTVLNVETSTAICCSLTLRRDIPRLVPPLLESDPELAQAWLEALGQSKEAAEALEDLAKVLDGKNPETAAVCYEKSKQAKDCCCSEPDPPLTTR